MFSDKISVYQKEDKYLVLNPHVPSWVVTNGIGLAVIKLYCESQSVEQIIKELTKHKLFLSEKSVCDFLTRIKSERLLEDSNVQHIHKPYFFYALYLNMTEECNLRCTYCYAAARKERGKSNLLLSDYERILNEAKALSHNGYVEVNFTGGEPLVSQNTIPIARRCKELGFNTKILTNATLITEKNVDELLHVFDSFKISLDGSTPERHDHYRGIGSYEKTFNAITLLKERGADVQLAMVVTKENKDDVRAMSDKWGSALKFQPLFPMGRAKDNSNVLSGKEYYFALEEVLNINAFSDVNGIIKAHTENRTIRKCAMGDGEISISCTGDVYPCQLLHYEPFYLGNVKMQSLTDIYNSDKNNSFKTHTVECIENCKTCDFKYLCGGACQARHFSETGTIEKAGDFCEYEKEGIINGLINSCKMVKL